MNEALISGVVAGSIAAQAQIMPGDRLLSINGELIHDMLDYQYACTDERVELILKDHQGRERQLALKKALDDDLGLRFADTVFDGMMKCQNHCQFCFVDQMPRGLRRSLYIKDDDYRYSFLFGSFVTLGNLRPQDWEKIERYHLSPLYISVHATAPELRQGLVKPKQQHDIMADLRRLAALGIEMHTQIVLCPGLNDGAVLERTVNDLASLIPLVRSIGVVPVGLTRYRDRLLPLQPVHEELAQELITRVQIWQEQFRLQTEDHSGFIYLADEFFVKAGVNFPDEEYYDGYPQLENGIGLCRLFWTGWEALEGQLPLQIASPQEYILITGVSALPVLTPVVKRLNQIKQLSVSLHPVENRFFGEQVTVTGLLTGQDIIASLKECTDRGTVLIPRIVLKEGENRLLDEMTVDDMAQASGYPMQVVGTDAADLLQALTILPQQRRRIVKAKVGKHK
ncbi:MAG: DUF512 domain-containing protein [Methylocystaceae bacterium]